jgi:hypothetical protein
MNRRTFAKNLFLGWVWIDALGRWFLNVLGYTSYRRMRIFVFTKCLTPCFLCSGAPFGSPVQTFDSISNPCFLEVSFKTSVLLIRIRSDRHHFGRSGSAWYPCETNVKFKKNYTFTFVKKISIQCPNYWQIWQWHCCEKRRKILFSNMCNTVPYLY